MVWHTKKSQFSKMLIFFKKCSVLINLQWQMGILGGPGTRWRVVATELRYRALGNELPIPENLDPPKNPKNLHF